MNNNGTYTEGGFSAFGGFINDLASAFGKVAPVFIRGNGANQDAQAAERAQAAQRQAADSSTLVKWLVIGAAALVGVVLLFTLLRRN